MKLLVQRDKEFRSALYDIMGFYPHNVELYRIAFAHKSQEYKSKKTGDRPLNNERLEFLGDAVLETVVSDIVYHHFKNKREGFLTNTRSKIVSRESLGKLAKDLGIDRLIQSHTNSKAHNSFLAGNAFEALMGAIYLDRGFDYAFRFIELRIMGSVLDLEGVAHKEVNFKSKLLEWSQKNRIRIDFKDKQQAASSSSTPTFFTTIVLEGLFAGDGKGFSKKEAHQNASKDALTRMRREPKFIDEIFTSKEKRTAMEADPCFVLPVIDEIEADLAREAEEKANGRKEQSKKESKKQQLKKEAKKEQQPKAESKKEQPKQQPKKEKVKQEKPADQQPVEKLKVEPVEKTEAKPVEKQKAEAQSEVPETVAPIVIPIALEDILETTDDNTSAVQAPEAPVAEETPAEAAPAAPVVEEVADEEPKAGNTPEAPIVAEDAPTTAEVPAEDAPVAEAAEAAAAPSKKPRRRGKRQNAAGFTNTDTIPAETSHRAEKAAKKVEEAKKEKARRNAKKSARAAAKGIEDVAPELNDNASSGSTATNDADQATAPQAAKGKKRGNAKKSGAATQVTADTTPQPAPEAASQPAAKKPRRRRKTKAELPSETPNPEREQAITAAENAAYQQSNTED